MNPRLDPPAESDLLIRTPRLDQIPMLRSHAASMFPVLADPDLYAFTGDDPPGSVEALALVYASRESRRSPDGKELWLNWMLRQRETGEGIGYTQATVSSTHAEVAWVVGTRWQNLGYASEAAAALVAWLQGLGIRDIRALVHPDHVASRRVARKAGLRVGDAVIDGEEVWEYRG